MPSNLNLTGNYIKLVVVFPKYYSLRLTSRNEIYCTLNDFTSQCINSGNRTVIF